MLISRYYGGENVVIVKICRNVHGKLVCSEVDTNIYNILVDGKMEVIILPEYKTITIRTLNLDVKGNKLYLYTK
jgi:hypothetical protein